MWRGWRTDNCVLVKEIYMMSWMNSIWWVKSPWFLGSPENPSLNLSSAIESTWIFFQHWGVFLPNTPGKRRNQVGSKHFVLFIPKLPLSPWEADAGPKCFCKSLMSWFPQWHFRDFLGDFGRGVLIKEGQGKDPDPRDSAVGLFLLQWEHFYLLQTGF